MILLKKYQASDTVQYVMIIDVKKNLISHQ